MSKIKLALDVVEDLKSLADSIETLVLAIEDNGSVNEADASINENMESSDNDLSTEVAKEPAKKKSKTKTKVEEPEQEIEEPEAEKPPEEKQPTLEEIRAVMADKSRDGHREAVKAIITKYGASTLSAMDPKHYASALKEVGELK